ncbi:hypothetical protein CH65_499 [Francisella tularensis subsp. tularensis]|nr:hypothetical protein CH65_499 [Francisella tularensis subsp. tularensis]KFJ65928.1 hypothetical protein DR81_860 [Francisella tularensis]
MLLIVGFKSVVIKPINSRVSILSGVLFFWSCSICILKSLHDNDNEYHYRLFKYKIQFFIAKK